MKTKSKRMFGFRFDNPFKIILNKTICRLFVLPRISLAVFPASMAAEEETALFGFYAHAVDYKNKFGEWRFEYAPYIQANIFGRAFRLNFSWPFRDDDSVCEYGYWEAILDVYCNYAYNDNNNFNLYKVLERNTWTNRDGKKEDMTRILTRCGLKRYYYDKEVLDVFYEKYGVNK